MSTVSICAPSRVHAHSHFVVMSSCGGLLDVTRSSASGSASASRSRSARGQRGGVVERTLLPVAAPPRPGRRGSAGSPQLGEQRVDVGAGRAVARARRCVTTPVGATSRPYARSVRWVTKPSARYSPTAASLAPSTKSMPDGDAARRRATRGRRWSARARARCPWRIGVGADHVDLAERVGLRGRLRRVHLRPAEPGEAVVVEREQEALGVEPGLLLPRRAACRRVQPPCSGWPAKARLFTVDPRGFVLARRRTCARSMPSGQRGGSASGSGTRIWRRSRSSANPARRGRASASARSAPWTQR